MDLGQILVETVIRFFVDLLMGLAVRLVRDF